MAIEYLKLFEFEGRFGESGMFRESDNRESLLNSTYLYSYRIKKIVVSSTLKRYSGGALVASYPQRWQLSTQESLYDRPPGDGTYIGVLGEGVYDCDIYMPNSNAGLDLVAFPENYTVPGANLWFGYFSSSDTGDITRVRNMTFEDVNRTSFGNNNDEYNGENLPSNYMWNYNTPLNSWGSRDWLFYNDGNSVWTPYYSTGDSANWTAVSSQSYSPTLCLNVARANVARVNGSRQVHDMNSSGTYTLWTTMSSDVVGPTNSYPRACTGPGDTMWWIPSSGYSTSIYGANLYNCGSSSTTAHHTFKCDILNNMSFGSYHDVQVSCLTLPGDENSYTLAPLYMYVWRRPASTANWHVAVFKFPAKEALKLTQAPTSTTHVDMNPYLEYQTYFASGISSPSSSVERSFVASGSCCFSVDTSSNRIIQFSLNPDYTVSRVEHTTTNTRQYTYGIMKMKENTMLYSGGQYGGYNLIDASGITNIDDYVKIEGWGVRES